mmetsp:Transcript_110033/g.190605  ORF Transcript_110033/g.190605 Transcript_110033/m.190605 type:complete len:149 (+) Transcript_110033:387-833(+)
MGFVDAHTRHAERVQREGIRGLHQARQYFGDLQEEYLTLVMSKLGGCPKVMVPRHRNVQRIPHIWAGLQDLVDRVKQPMWLPGKSGDPTHIILKRRKETPDTMSPPEEEEWEALTLACKKGGCKRSGNTFSKGCLEMGCWALFEFLTL